MRNILPANIRASGMQATVLLLSSVLNSCAPVTLPADSGGLHTFHDGGLTFRYPDAWREFRHSVASSFSNIARRLRDRRRPRPLCQPTRQRRHRNGVRRSLPSRALRARNRPSDRPWQLLHDRRLDPRAGLAPTRRAGPSTRRHGLFRSLITTRSALGGLESW